MTRDDIIKLALEAGFEEYEWSSLSGDSELDQTLQVGEYPVGEAVFKFAALVAAAEREAIAQMIEDAPALVKFATNDHGGCLVCGFTPKLAAAAIRARS